MEARLEQIIHELKQVGEMQRHFQYNIDRLKEIEERYTKRVKKLEKEMNGYIVNER